MENIMIVKDLEIKIIDFGLAYLSGTGVPFQEALNVGTLLYAAPEIILCQLKTVNKSVDVWGLGVMLYLMVFGEYPFYGVSEKEILTNITKG
jgi:serine/threonine protein kinase